MKYTLKKPSLDDVKPDQVLQMLYKEDTGKIFDFIKKFLNTDYIYWDEFKYKEPIPKSIKREELWFLIKLFRKSKSLKTPINDIKEETFTWSKLDYFEEFFHELDMSTGGELFVGKDGIDKSNKQKLITRGIMEEAIASSQLEGAATTRQVAKKMLREGRKPKNSSEQMIVNSYTSMKAIEEKYKDKEMSMDLILELHGIITKDTLDSDGNKPRMRKEGEPIYVNDKLTGEIYHKGPEVNFVEKELKKLIKFANDDLKQEAFLHPIIKAIMIHFWIGYLHPFTDGNGRLARQLFYWYLIKHGYWAFVYLPISKIIKLSPKQYILAYVYSEQDDNDLTYFIDYNVKKIKLALMDFKKYVNRQSQGNTKMKKISEQKYKLNMRQVQLLQYLHGDPDERTNLTIHMNINQIAKMTASKDLKDLEEKGFLSSQKQGRHVYYYGTEKIKTLF
ncbi:MAG: cell filamentation protein Fic [Candidatus Magasanikbacteria bacterium CG_4_10_14_0_2_um_filter_41_10]|uniref:Cell filamentation protein Fic n=2 Tax=Candidatus Magasanikiibacteriota TaxID=1752731 RepID=A0A2M7V5R1_9BACT|nr:MAG: cell filamentation protein Fic [Candidatus Magasanikbacteria bacterium CG_4_10_14_0_2_um_filter_41_10]